MNCAKCGVALREGAKFCGKCGTTVAAQAGAPAAAPGPGISQGVRCPTCGTENPVGAKFCRKDGVSLGIAAAPNAGGSPAPAAPPASAPPVPPRAALAPTPQPARVAPPPPRAPAPRAAKSRAPLLIALGVVALAALGGGGFFAYQKGWVGNRQGVVAEQLNAKLGEAGIEGIQVEIDRAWTATLSGRVTTPDQSEQAEALVSESEDVADVDNDVRVVPDAKALLAGVSKLGLPGATRSENADGSVTWTKNAASLSLSIAGDKSLGIAGRQHGQPDQSALLTIDESGTVLITGEADISVAPVKELLSSVAGVVSVTDKTTQSAAYRMREADAALQAAGFPAVTARVEEDGVLVLSGAVPTPAERARAETVVTQQAGRDDVVRNVVEIREATLAAPSSGALAQLGAAAPSSQASQPAAGAPRARLSGLWIGDARGTLLSYGVNLRMVDAGVGQAAGESIYALNNQVICRGQLAVAQSDAGSTTLQDTIGQILNPACNFGGTLILKAQNDGTIYAEWMSKSRAGKVAYKAVLRRR